MPNAKSLRNPCCADNPARSNSPALVRLAVEDAPVVLREHGYQDAHRFPLVSPDVGPGAAFVPGSAIGGVDVPTA